MAIYMWRDAPGIYWSSTLGLISLADNDGNVITIADKNLGATQVYNSGDTLSQDNCGKLYQWGNNNPFKWTGNINTNSTQVNTSNYGPGNYYNDGTFRGGSGSMVDWSNPSNDNLWGLVTGTFDAMQGPCDSGFHIPSYDELDSLNSIGVALGAWTSNGGTDFSLYLHIPFGGYRPMVSSGYSTLQQSGTTGMYWGNSTSTASTAYARGFMMMSSYIGSGDTPRVSACSIRPFKNEAVQPDDTWTVLYQAN